MADFLQHVIGSPHPAISSNGGAVTFGSHVLDGATDAVEWVFNTPAAITITRLGFRYGARTGTPPTFKISLQAVDASGNPDGTILGGGSPASATFTPPADATWDGTWRWITLANTFTTTRGQYLAIVLKYDSGTIDASNKSSINTSNTTALEIFPAAIHNEATVRTRQAAMPVFAYSSASKVYGRPISGSYAPNLTVSSTPDEVALRWTLNSGYGDTYKVVGAEFAIRHAVGQSVNIILYDGTTVLQSVSFDTDLMGNAGTQRTSRVYFDETTLSSLSFGSVYRLASQILGSGTNIPIGLQVSTAADMAAWAGGEDFYLSTRTDAGAWTDDATIRPFIAPIIEEWSEPTGGGPIGPGRLTGGLQ